jgi:3-oxocholest-4-en-26-oate---CoA ligase
MEFNLAQVHEAVEDAVPDRECIVFRDRRLSYREIGRRSRRLANVMLARGLGDVTDRSTLADHQSGQDHLAVYLHNGNEYLESMLGAYKARVAPFNVNHRYVAEELEYLLDDAGARAIVYHSAFAPTLDQVRHRLPRLQTLLQVHDGSDLELLAGAEWYEDALAAASDTLPVEVVTSWSPDDLYIVYTGGTTGMPKGVLWRQADIFVAALGGRRLDSGEEWTSLEEIAANARADGSMRLLAGPPFMHGAAHWLAFNGFTNANTIVIPSTVDHLDPDEVIEVIETERVQVLLIVGDAFGRPLVEAMERSNRNLSSLLVTVSGGAALSPGLKERLLAAVPTMMLLDGLGASETGQQASQIGSGGLTPTTGTFSPLPGMAVLNDDFSGRLDPGDTEQGWLAQSGRIPIGYLGDPERTSRTFPVVDGTRYAIPGDRASFDGQGLVRLHGRESATINSGGEKIFAEEVEQALIRHPSVADCLVVGRPSQRWGEEVVAVVQLVDGIEANDADLLEEAARHIARFKLPKAILRMGRVERSPSGKADYRWAGAVAADDAAVGLR